MDTISVATAVTSGYYCYTPLISCDVHSLNLEIYRLKCLCSNPAEILHSLVKGMIISFVHIFIKPLVTIYELSRNPADAISLIKVLLSNEIFFLSTLILLPLGVTLNCLGVNSILNLYASLSSLSTYEEIPLELRGDDSDDYASSIGSDDDFYTPPSSNNSVCLIDDLNEERESDYPEVDLAESSVDSEDNLEDGLNLYDVKILRNMLNPILLGYNVVSSDIPVDFFPEHFTEKMILDAKTAIMEIMTQIEKEGHTLSRLEALCCVDIFKEELLSCEKEIDSLRHVQDCVGLFLGKAKARAAPYGQFSTANFTRAMCDKEKKIVEEIIGLIYKSNSFTLVWNVPEILSLGMQLSGRVTALEFFEYALSNEKTRKEMTEIRKSFAKYTLIQKSICGPLESFVKRLDADSVHFSGFLRAINLDMDGVMKIVHSDEPDMVGRFMDYFFEVNGIDIS